MVSSKEMLGPLRTVVKERLGSMEGRQFRIWTLSCGHTVTRVPSAKLAERVRCNECLRWGDA
jgi:hypothetical protein